MEQSKERAIILAAGRGKRMGILTANQPKSFTKIKNRSLIEWVVQALRGAGIRDIVVVRGYCAGAFTDASLTYFDNVGWEESNMVATLFAADAWLSQYPCVVSYADIAYPADTITKLLGVKGDIVIPYNTAWFDLWGKRFVDPLSDAETFCVDQKGMLTDIGRRPDSLDEVEGQYMGLMKITPHGWKELKAIIGTDLKTLDMTMLLSRALKAGVWIGTVSIDGKWVEVDSETDIILYEKLARSTSYLDWLR